MNLEEVEDNDRNIMVKLIEALTIYSGKTDNLVYNLTDKIISDSENDSIDIESYEFIISDISTRENTESYIITLISELQKINKK